MFLPLRNDLHIPVPSGWVSLPASLSLHHVLYKKQKQYGGGADVFLDQLSFYEPVCFRHKLSILIEKILKLCKQSCLVHGFQNVIGWLQLHYGQHALPVSVPCQKHHRYLSRFRIPP